MVHQRQDTIRMKENKMNRKKNLIIVESPKKATKIAEYLEGEDDLYIIKSSKGHITELSKKNMGIDIEKDFATHYTLMQDKIDIVDDLIKTAKECDFVILMSDGDREGEQIAHMLKERLYLEEMNIPFKRAVANKIDKKNILNAIKDMRDIDMNLVHSQMARSILDRIIGFSCSPFLWQTLNNHKLSAGRTQSPCCKMVVEKILEIKNFKSEIFYTIQVSLSKDNQTGFITKYPNKLIDENIAKDIKNRLSTKNAQYVVSNVERCEERKGPFPPLITSSLQQIMSKIHGVSADSCMKGAQSLYESGYISYMRTDSVRLEQSDIDMARQWLKDNNHKIPDKPNIYNNKGDFAQDAHTAITPIDLSIIPDKNYAILDPIEKLVYKEVWKAFICSQMCPAIYDTLKITAHVDGDKEAVVKASGKAIKDLGYLLVMGSDNENTTIDIPDLSVGDKLFLFGAKPVKLEKKSTQPPAPYTEDRIISELKRRGIGRPSTYSNIISTLTTRGYVEKRGSKNNIFYSTELGEKVIELLANNFKFLSYDYTAKMEEQLDLIEQGKLNYIEMLKQFYSTFKQELDNAYKAHGATFCEKCNSPMSIRTTKDGSRKFLGCSNYPKCKNIKNIEL
jgi:DNA topoisomerase-1